MPRPLRKFRMETGEKISVPELVEHPRNTWPVSYQVIYERLKAGERDIEQLLRPPAHGQPMPQAPKSSRVRRVSPWRLGPALNTPRSRKIHQQIHDVARPARNRSGERIGALRVLHHGPVQEGRPTWCCQCDCGDKVTYREDHLDLASDCGCGISERRKRA